MCAGVPRGDSMACSKKIHKTKNTGVPRLDSIAVEKPQATVDTRDSQARVPLRAGGRVTCHTPASLAPKANVRSAVDLYRKHTRALTFQNFSGRNAWYKFATDKKNILHRQLSSGSVL